MSKITIKILFVVLIVFCVCNSVLGNSLNNQDTTNIPGRIWAVQAGYFHNYTNSFSSSGISFVFLSESVSPKSIDTGWYLSLLSSVGSNQSTQFEEKIEGSISFGWFWNHSIRIYKSSFLVRGGIGLGLFQIAPGLINMLMLEYIIPVKRVEFSITLIQEIIQFRHLLPVQINLGIRF